MKAKTSIPNTGGNKYGHTLPEMQKVHRNNMQALNKSYELFKEKLINIKPAIESLRGSATLKQSNYEDIKNRISSFTCKQGKRLSK